MKKIFVICALLSSMVYATETKLIDAMKSYENLYDAVFLQDLEKIQASASKLNADLALLENDETKKKLKYSMEKLKELAQEDDLEKGHEAFNIVSQGLLMILEKDKNLTYNRYYCPMVKKYWIQNVAVNDEVKNPYAPKSMPNCGARK